MINPDCPQQRFLTEQPQSSQHLGYSTLRQSLQILKVQVLKHCRKKGVVSGPAAVRMPLVGDSSEAVAALQSPASKIVSIKGRGKGPSHSLGAAHLQPTLSLVAQTSPSPQHGDSYAFPAGSVPKCLRAEDSGRSHSQVQHQGPQSIPGELFCHSHGLAMENELALHYQQ